MARKTPLQAALDRFAADLKSGGQYSMGVPDMPIDDGGVGGFVRNTKKAKLDFEFGSLSVSNTAQISLGWFVYGKNDAGNNNVFIAFSLAAYSPSLAMVLRSVPGIVYTPTGYDNLPRGCDMRWYCPVDSLDMVFNAIEEHAPRNWEVDVSNLLGVVLLLRSPRNSVMYSQHAKIAIPSIGTSAMIQANATLAKAINVGNVRIPPVKEIKFCVELEVLHVFPFSQRVSVDITDPPNEFGMPVRRDLRAYRGYLTNPIGRNAAIPGVLGTDTPNVVLPMGNMAHYFDNNPPPNLVTKRIQDMMPWEVLGLNSDVVLATNPDEAIKAAYRKQVIQYHPDTYRGNDPTYARAMFDALTVSRTILLNPVKRRRLQAAAGDSISKPKWTDEQLCEAAFNGTACCGKLVGHIERMPDDVYYLHRIDRWIYWQKDGRYAHSRVNHLEGRIEITYP